MPTMSFRPPSLPWSPAAQAHAAQLYLQRRQAPSGSCCGFSRCWADTRGPRARRRRVFVLSSGRVRTPSSLCSFRRGRHLSRRSSWGSGQSRIRQSSTKVPTCSWRSWIKPRRCGRARDRTAVRPEIGDLAWPLGSRAPADDCEAGPWAYGRGEPRIYSARGLGEARGYMEGPAACLEGRGEASGPAGAPAWSPCRPPCCRRTRCRDQQSGRSRRGAAVCWRSR